MPEPAFVYRALDLTGQVCPVPTVSTLEALKQIPAGALLRVTLDYLPARQTLPRLLDDRGHPWRLTADDGTTFVIEIEGGQT